MNAYSARWWRRGASWFTFAAALTVYLLTLEPDASFWDCPEYLVTAARLEIGHPPGNPVWTLTARIFSLFGGDDPQRIAICVNASSAIFTAAAAAILTSVVFIMLRFIGGRRGRGRLLSIAAVAVAAGLTFAWSDSPWFSAVEAEVYAMSLFLTALTVRLMIGWFFTRDPRLRGRRLLLIVYIIGLSIGVHQLNLLVIPALSLIWLFRMRRGKAGFWRIIATLLLSAAAVGVILLGFMPGVIRLAGCMELLCVNSWHMPIHSGVWVFWIGACVLLIAIPLIVAHFSRSPRVWPQVLAWIPAMLLVGFSSYMILLVRSAANPPMNEAAPSNIFSLAEYLNRDQYGKNPLLYGKTPNSRPMRQERIKEDGTPDYSQLARKVKSPRYLPSPDGKSYRHYSDNTELIYTPELDMLLPRMTSGNAADIECYGDWAGMTQDAMKSVEISYALDSTGHPVGRLNTDGSRARETELRPTYLQQIRYLLTYQIGYMYFRYLLWNYCGRQNDRFATGEAEHGNFLTGLPWADDAMLGPQAKMPSEIGKANRGRNLFYGIPLLLGILGMIWLQRQGRRGRRINLIITLLFLMTGVAIVLYLNQAPREVRERDYSFLGSFWAYALWIAAGLRALLPQKREASALAAPPKREAVSARGYAALLTLLLPAAMLLINYDDHDRSHRTATTDFAANLLDSLEPDAILFTNGDNFTFPLWWAQEVAGIRRDVTVINTAYLTTPWYVCQLMMDGPGPDSATPRKGLLMQASDTTIRYGAFTSNPYQRTEVTPSRADTLLATDAVEALRRRYAEPSYRMPGMLRLPLPQSISADSSRDTLYLRSQAVASGSGMIGQRQLATLDIIASNLQSARPRPVYWLSALSSSDYAGFYPFTTRTLHTRRLVYTDTLTPPLAGRMLDLDLQSARANRNGHMDRDGIYADATVGAQLTVQRLGLLRLGERLLAAGRTADALEIARLVKREYPAATWEYQICNETDGPLYEGFALADLLIKASPAAGADSATVRKEGEEILRRERARQAEWKRYYQSLSPRLRTVLTPKHRQFIQYTD